MTWKTKGSRMVILSIALMAYCCFKVLANDGPSNITLRPYSHFLAAITENFRYLEKRADLGFQSIFDSLADADFQFESKLVSSLRRSFKLAVEPFNWTIVVFERSRLTETEQQRSGSLNISSPKNGRSYPEPKLSDVMTDLQVSKHEVDTLMSKLQGFSPPYVEYPDSPKTKTQKSFVELFETSKSAEISSLRLRSDAERANIAHRPSAQAQLVPIANNALLDEEFWKRYYEWKTNPIPENDSLTIIDAVQLNLVKNHFSPYYHVESTLSRRYSNRIVPQYAADLDLESSARIFPLNIAQDMSMSESSILFIQNIKALSALGSLIDDTVAAFNAIENIIAPWSPLPSSLGKISSMVFGTDGESFESVRSLHATTMSLEHIVNEKLIRLKVDHIGHMISTHVLNMEMERKLQSIEASMSSDAWYQSLNALYHHEDSMNIIFTEMILDEVNTKIQHANDLYLIAHDYSRSLTKIVEEGKASVSFHRATIQAEAANERKNEFITLGRIKIIGEEGRKTALHLIDICSTQISNALVFLISTKDGLQTACLLLVFLLLLVFSLAFVRHIVMIAVVLARKAFLMPTLIRESRGSAYFLTRRNRSTIPKIILPQNQQGKLHNLVKTMSSARAGGALRNLLIHGPSGSGKTLLTRHLLRSVPEVPYIIMSGADLVPLGRSAPTELKRIISWGIRKKGIIVIDEAECALGTRSSQSEHLLTSDSTDAAAARDIINTFLSLTGEASSELMLIIVTCHPEKLDDAILDRCDEIFRLNFPCQSERLLIVNECFSNKFGRRRGQQRCVYSSEFDMKLLHQLSSDDTEGFSGREINQIIKAISEETLLTVDNTMTTCIWERVSKRMCSSIRMKKQMISD